MSIDRRSGKRVAGNKQPVSHREQLAGKTCGNAAVAIIDSLIVSKASKLLAMPSRAEVNASIDLIGGGLPFSEPETSARIFQETIEQSPENLGKRVTGEGVERQHFIPWIVQEERAQE